MASVGCRRDQSIRIEVDLEVDSDHQPRASSHRAPSEILAAASPVPSQTHGAMQFSYRNANISELCLSVVLPEVLGRGGHLRSPLGQKRPIPKCDGNTTLWFTLITY